MAGRIVAVASVAQAITIGLTLIPFSLFITPLVDEFDLPVAQILIGMGLFTLVMMGAGVGVLLDRFSICVIMTDGAFLMALSLVLMSVAIRPWQLGALFGVGLGTGVAMAGPLAATTVIARWLGERRGLAMGLASMGPSFGGLSLVPAGGWLLEEFGWRVVIQVFGCFPLGLGPLCFLVVRNSPADVGQAMDGWPVGAGPENSGVSPEEWSAPQIVRTRNFWAIALGVGSSLVLAATGMQTWRDSVRNWATAVRRCRL